MKNLIILIVCCFFIFAGCSNNQMVYSFKDFVKDFEEEATDVEFSIIAQGNISELFETETMAIKLKDMERDIITIYEYANPNIAEKMASKIGVDGSSIGKAEVSWAAPPRFYKRDNLIVVYGGNEKKITDILKNILGPQFAGTKQKIT